MRQVNGTVRPISERRELSNFGPEATSTIGPFRSGTGEVSGDLWSGFGAQVRFESARGQNETRTAGGHSQRGNMADGVGHGRCEFPFAPLQPSERPAAGSSALADVIKVAARQVFT